MIRAPYLAKGALHDKNPKSGEKSAIGYQQSPVEAASPRRGVGVTVLLGILRRAIQVLLGILRCAIQVLLGVLRCAIQVLLGVLRCAIQVLFGILR